MITNNISYPKEQKTRNKGIVRASLLSSVAVAPLQKLSSALIKRVPEVSKEDSITIRRNFSQALTDTGLREKGVKASFVNSVEPKNLEETISTIVNLVIQPTKKDAKAMDYIADGMEKCLKKKKSGKRLLENLTEFAGDDAELKQMSKRIVSIPIISQVKLGKNAFYMDASKSIVVPDKKFVTSAFHELGHAINANKSKIGKFLQKNRRFSMLAPSIISTVALFTKKKADDETPNKGVGKVTHFVKRNAGKLAFLSMLPVLAEEAMASVKGTNIAKGMLDKNLLKKVKATNALGLATYAISAIGVGVSTALAVKIKDSIQEKHEAKVAQNATKKLEK